MRALKTVGTVLVGLSTVGGFALQLLDYAGVEFDGVVGAVFLCSDVWLPMVALLLGIAIGSFVSQRKAKSHLAAKDARIKTLIEQKAQIEKLFQHNRACSKRFQYLKDGLRGASSYMNAADRALVEQFVKEAEAIE